jgi:hypothetical protein
LTDFTTQRKIGYDMFGRGGNVRVLKNYFGMGSPLKYEWGNSLGWGGTVGWKVEKW